ncbi:MAG: phenylacetate--CoA ligase [Alphaproteobacteria bacterium]|nr:phenylacetate--CoA ligase [Alphaproteobacteria bacterium]
MSSRAKSDSALEPIEQASRDALEALQLERLKWSLRHTYDNVAFYRAKCLAVGVHPHDLRTLADLAHFPFTTKDDLRASYPYSHFAVPMRDVVRVHASSGTTGQATVVGYSRADIELWSNLMARSIRAAGGGPDDIIQVAYGYGLFTGGLGAHYGGERLGATVIPISAGQTERQAQLIVDLKPTIIMATPSYLLVIADELERRGIDPRSTALRIGILGAEPWGERLRNEIETRLRIDALDIYGLSEVIGPGVAQECLQTKDGLHVWEDHFYPEIIEPESGRALPDGATGELVFTSLTKEATPVIRYRTRDLSALLPGTARPMRRMAKVIGRSDDMLIIRGINLYPSQIEALILKDPRLAPVYLLEIGREGHLDTLTVLIEARPGQNASVAARELTREIKSAAGISATVRAVEPGTIPRSAGKAKRVSDLRPKD